jgi:hypothetical protein
VAASTDFHWVVVNRDRDPANDEYFNVSAYPSLIAINPQREEIYRFSGYSLPPVFRNELAEALRRWALYRAGRVWDEPKPRPPRIMDSGRLNTLPAPSEEVPSGMTFLDGWLWVAQRDSLYRIDPATGSVEARFAIDPHIRDLTTDGRLIYGVAYGWTAGEPIFVIDPATGNTLRTIVTEANKVNKYYAAAGIAWFEGKLLVLEGSWGRIHVVDPATGVVSRVIQSQERWLTSLEQYGDLLIATARQELVMLDPESGEVILRTPANYPLRVVAYAAGVHYLMEQPVFGYDRHHRNIRVWPVRTVIYLVRSPW